MSRKDELVKNLVYFISKALMIWIFLLHPIFYQESERKTYNPRSFCKVYTMDHQPLNTAEQKDMAEFFIDLVSKLEEMTPELKELVKNLFGGVISNNVVSLVSFARCGSAVEHPGVLVCWHRRNSLNL